VRARSLGQSFAVAWIVLVVALHSVQFLGRGSALYGEAEVSVPWMRAFRQRFASLFTRRSAI
jgi:hypothetical protein